VRFRAGRGGHERPVVAPPLPPSEPETPDDPDVVESVPDPEPPPDLPRPGEPYPAPDPGVPYPVPDAGYRGTCSNARDGSVLQHPGRSGLKTRESRKWLQRRAPNRAARR